MSPKWNDFRNVTLGRINKSEKKCSSEETKNLSPNVRKIVNFALLIRISEPCYVNMLWNDIKTLFVYNLIIGLLELLREVLLKVRIISALLQKKRSWSKNSCFTHQNIKNTYVTR